ncbi:ABC transporter permease [Arthrobacter sp. VKM Ac-2550]|uniref:ABC transporter permease n=1 Tax=Crystallibacter permensis TaxID=1938888 RepID=UPI0022280991|nr:FtsX-like permease family protein [Arthrobacter sp. VKM Ac-2550]MCW2131739.1 putative ABC transport system permease protein [Arthrobacter sp. VKM Ac-2550]
MLQVALAQVKQHARRFIAVALAVVMAVGFLTATLMVNASTEASLGNSVGAGFRNADLVLSSGPDKPLDEQAAEAVADADGVAEVYVQQQTHVAFGTAGEAGYGALQNTAPSAGLDNLELIEGALPGSGEVAVDDATAERLALTVGSKLEFAPGAGMAAAEDVAASGIPATVSAIVKASKDPLMMGQPQFFGTSGFIAALADEQAPVQVRSIQLDLAAGTDTAAAKDAVAAALTAAGFAESTVNTAAEQTKEVVAGFTGGTDQLTIVLLAFALVAVLVSALVVANTFSVLIAQRTRELALLRCIGAGRGQIRRSVLVEALLVGVVASVIGVLGAVGLMAGIIAVLQGRPDTEFAALAVPPLAVAVGLVTGVVMTVLAALAPARAATTVAPLAALRPAEDVRVGNRKGKVRLGFGIALVVGGAVVLGLGALNANLLIALPGGAMSFIGLLLCATLFVPPLVTAVGALARPLGVPGKLAAVNAVRNPGRTSATATALLIGVTLVVMMMTGAQTARTAFESELSAQYPVDISIGNLAEDGGQLDEAAAETALTYDGVAAAGLITTGGYATVNGQRTGVYQLTPAQRELLQDQSLTLDADTVLLAEGSGLDTLTVTGSSGSKEFQVVEVSSFSFPPLMSSAVAEEIGVPAPAAADSEEYFSALPQLWLSVDRDLDATALMELRSELAAGLNVQDYQISGAAIERAAFNQIIDVLLLVVTGLLAVAVLIALVGVANTLSLSVLERTQESSLLRALGLTRNQLRGMLALEAVLIAGVAALIGSGLGSLYGRLGAQSALGTFTAVVPDVPWLQLAAVLAVAVVAGLLASVMPARRAARLSPVEGLATV